MTHDWFTKHKAQKKGHKNAKLTKRNKLETISKTLKKLSNHFFLELKKPLG